MAEQTALYNQHIRLTDKSHIVPFAGYLMPLWYSSIAEEHAAVRESAGIFDCTHMGVLGISRIQFGVILISGLAIGLVTPPVGMCLNVASAISKLGIGTIFRAALPFLLANIITLILITYIPHLSMWLPALLFD